MSDGHSDRRKDFHRCGREHSQHRFEDDRLFIDHVIDLRKHPRTVASSVGTVAVRHLFHEIVRNDETDQGLTGEGHLHACSRWRVGLARSEPVVEELIERDGQGDAHDSIVCGIVGIQRRQAVEKGGGHGEILCTAAARGKAANPNRRFGRHALSRRR